MMKTKLLLVLLSLSLLFTGAFAQEQIDSETKDAAYVTYEMDGEEYDHVFKAKPLGENEVPPVDTKGRGNFVAHVDNDYTGFRFNLVINNIYNVVAAHIHLGMPGENGPPVATLYGPADPGGGRQNGVLAKGVITADDLFGPLEGMTLVALIEEIKAGNAYINVHTNDGMGEDNTGPGDMMSGELRDQIELKGTLPPALARLQVIHNAADPAASEVDVYVNGSLLLNDFAFRAATPYIDVPAGLELEIGVAPGTSTGPGDILATFPVTLAVNETYAVIANGVLDPSGFAANPDGRDIGFTLFAKAPAREMAMDMSMVDFFALHGSTDAPTVDVIARGVATLVDDAAYGDMTDYLSVPPASYILDVTPGGDNSTIVASFEADLSGLAGGAAVVFASGFLTPADNQDGAAFGLFAALPNGTVVEFPPVDPPVTTARLQVIHNAADPGAASVDIYVNDALTLDDFAFRAATPYLDVPAGVELVIGVAPGTSTGPGDIIATFPVTLTAGETYAVVANGVLDPSGFAANPDGRDIGFTLFTKTPAREAAMDVSMVEFFALHGSTDAPTVDVIARGVATLVDNAAYGDMTDYLAVPPASYILDVTPGDDNSSIVASFEADLSGLAGGAAVVFASGFLDPSANQAGQPFGLFAALPNGTVVEFPPYVDTNTAAYERFWIDRDEEPSIEKLIALDGSSSEEGISGSKDRPMLMTGDGGNDSNHLFYAWLNGKQEVPPHWTMSKGVFMAKVDDEYTGLRFKLYGWYLKNVVAAHIHLGARGENGPPVATLYGPMEPGGGWTKWLCEEGVITEADLFGPLAGQPLTALIDALASGDAYVNIHTDDGEDGDNTGMGDYISGEIRGQIKLYGTLPEPPMPTTARLQVIHNAADPAAAEVDIYVNGDLLLDNFAFRAATPYIDVPAGVELTIGVAPGTSMGPGDIIATFPVTLTAGETYAVIANGVLDPTMFAANPDGLDIAFTLFAKAGAREAAMDMSMVEFFALHGSTDAPTVDVIARGVATLVDNAAYGDMTDYIPVPPASYILDVTPGDDNSFIVASFEADLSGLAGGAAVVFASGFLDPAANMGGEAFGLFAALPNGTVVEFPALTEARLQVIHNAADPGAAEVDIYVNDGLLLDDFAFRAATPYIDVPGNVELVIGVAPGTSTGPGDIIATFPVTLMAGETYAVIANGVLDPTMFAPNPDGLDIAFTLFPKAGAREAAMDMSMVEFFAFHGSTDAPTVDVIARGVATLVDDAAYGDMTGYLAVPPASYILDVTPGGDNSTIVATFEADLSGLAGGAAVVFASGFLTPADNQNGSGFGLFAALPDGSVVEFPALTMARLQVIHNAADPGAAEVDIYVNGAPTLDDFAFRTATPYIDVPGNTLLEIGVAPGTSTGPGDIIATFPVTLMAGETYAVIANGVLDPTMFAANPDGLEIGFSIYPKVGAREAAVDMALVDFFAFHGSTDAPTVDVIARDVATLVDNAAYGDMTGYLSVPPASYILDVTPGDDNATVVASFEADLSGLAGGAAVVFASGFLTPADNQGGAAFGLFAALPNGAVVEFPPADPPTPTARLQVIHNAADPAAAEVDIYVGDDLLLDDFAFRAATPYIDVPAGVELVIGVAPGTSTGPGDIIATFPVTLEADETYAVIANGVLDPGAFAANPDGRDIGFTLYAKAGAREAAMDPTMVEFFTLHGVTDAPKVDVYVFFGQLVVDDAKYGDMTGYESLAPKKQKALVLANYDGIWDWDFTIVGLYEIDLTGLDGGAAVVFASGFVDPAANQDGEGFGLFAALPNGAVAEFQQLYCSKADAKALVEEMRRPEQDEDIPVADTYGLEQNHPNPFNPVTTIAFNLPAREHVTLKVYDVRGREVATLVNGTRAAGRHEVSFEAFNIASGIYFYRLRAGEFLATRKMIVIR